VIQVCVPISFKDIGMEIDRKELLKNKEVLEEIHRYKWLQSEMAGADIGFEAAADAWFREHASAWLSHYFPKGKPHEKKVRGVPRILLIDDDDAFRSMLKDMLERAGYAVISAANGKEGIDRYRESPTDLVITDIIMPEKEGIETIIDLQKDFPDVRIIAISGGGRMKSDALLQIAACLSNVKDSLNKPFSKEEILRSIEDALKD
jgi:CheY-like chemotaxis protein